MGKVNLAKGLRYCILHALLATPRAIRIGLQKRKTFIWLLIEAAFSVRLHQRCATCDLRNDFDANGEDFVAPGLPSRF